MKKRGFEVSFLKIELALNMKSIQTGLAQCVWGVG